MSENNNQAPTRKAIREVTEAKWHALTDREKADVDAVRMPDGFRFAVNTNPMTRLIRARKEEKR